MSYLGRSAKLSLKAQEKVSFLATAGQTVKTGLSYVPSFVEVYVNGVLLTDTTDFTATNGSSVTFTVALLLNDEVTVISLKTFTVADHYSKTEADTLLAAKATNTDLATTNTAVALKAPIASPSFTGNVGVGTSASNAKLEVAASSGEIFRADAAGGAYRIVANQDGVLMNGNVGVGVTPEAWQAGWTAQQIGARSNTVYTAGGAFRTNNAYRDSVNSRWEYQATDQACMYELSDSGTHAFYVAPSGTADAAISWNTAMSIDNAGIVTKPLQPAFSLSKTSDQTIPSDTETTVSFQTEAFDVNSDCTSGVFTAPVDGTYVFYFQARLNDPNRSANYLDVRIITSGRPYKTLKDFGGYSSSNYETMESTIITQMDAGDTASPALYVSSGTQVVGFDVTRTHFSGYLIG
jgi:hypothetical protein